MPKILVVDDDIEILDVWSDVLRREGFEVVTAECGCRGVSLAVSQSFDVILLELRLPHMSGLEVATRLREAHVASALVIVTGSGSVRSAVDAMRLGVVDFVEKPLRDGDLLRVAQSALAARRSLNGEAFPHDLRVEPHATTRWAKMVARVIHSNRDLKTLHAWASFIAISHGTLKSWCRTANLSPRRSLVFARLLRAVILQQESGRKFEELLDVIDRRTLNTMLTLGGLCSNGVVSPDSMGSIERFLATQCLVRDPHALGEVKRLLATQNPERYCPSARPERTDVCATAVQGRLWLDGYAHAGQRR
jgi:DNA-binding response OmpR family regulator